MAAFTDARIAALKAGLELTPDQAKNWPAFEQALRDMAQLRIQRMQARASAASQQQGQTLRPTPFDRLARRADDMAKSSAALKQIADAGAPLYQSLNDEQKDRFMMLARMLRPHHRCTRATKIMAGAGVRARLWQRRRRGGNRRGFEGRRFGPRRSAGRAFRCRMPSTTKARRRTLMLGKLPERPLDCPSRSGRQSGSRRTCPAAFAFLMIATGVSRASGPSAFFQASMPPSMWQARREAGVLRRLHRHGRALAERAVEHHALAGRRRQFVQHAAGADILRQIRIGRMQRAGNDAVLLALAFLAQIDDRDVGAAA